MSDENSDEGSTISQASGRQRHKANQHPPGFKEIRSREDKLTEKQAEDDFELWFTNFEEATLAYGWSDDQKAGWFSWFISGPAKATWQRTLTAEQKTYRGHSMQIRSECQRETTGRTAVHWRGVH